MALPMRIFWYVTAPTANLFAFDATNLANEFYDSTMVASRDKFGPPVHFEMPIVADGRVYVNGQTQLTVFGLLPTFTAAAGNNQSGVVGSNPPHCLASGSSGSLLRERHSDCRHSSDFQSQRRRWHVLKQERDNQQLPESPLLLTLCPLQPVHTPLRRPVLDTPPQISRQRPP